LLLLDVGCDFRPLEDIGAPRGEESCRNGTFMVRVMVLVIGPSRSMSSGSASTVTLIFQGLRFCSETVRKGDEGIAMCPSEAALEFLPRSLVTVARCVLDGDCRLP
jgi:hypothetical protein